jgi:hypothetical protein
MSKNLSARSGSLTVVEAQDTTEPLSACDGAAVVSRCSTLNEATTQTLVKPVGVIVGGVLGDQVSEVSLAKDEKLVQGLVLDGPDEALGMGIEVGAARRQLDWFHTTRLEEVLKRLGEEGIAVVDEVAGVSEKAVDRVGDVFGNLFHPFAVWVTSNPGDLDASRFELNHEEDEIANRVLFENTIGVSGSRW